MFYYILLLKLVQSGYISTWDLNLEYDIEGKLDLIKIPFSLETSINNGYLQLGGIELHQTQMNEIICQIYTLDDILIIDTIGSLITQPSFTSDYYFQISQQLNTQQWYILKIYPTKVDSGFYYEPLILRTISSLDDNAMIYDYNYGIGHINVDELPPSGMSISFNVDNELYPTYKCPGTQYVITIYITPRISSNGAEIDLQILPGSNEQGGINEYDFKILSESCWSNFKQYICTTTKNTIKLLTQNDMISNQQIQIQFGIENPGFNSKRDIRIVTKSPQQGNRILEKGFRSNVFEVLPFDASIENVELLWGIQQDDELINTKVKLFQMQNQLEFYGPYNSVKISFTVTQSVNLVYPLQISIDLDCDYALSYSTKHNFIQFDEENPVYCEFILKSIICHNIGTLSPSNTYFISTKVIYLNTLPIKTKVDFKLSLILEQSDTINILKVYDSGNPETIDIIQDNHFLDRGIKGWHEPSIGFLGQTQVISIPDNTLINLDSIFGSTGTIGIVNGDKMLLFFLKVLDTQLYSSTSCSVDTIKMTILMNSQILHSDYQNIPKKLQYIANDGGGVYIDDQFICVKNGRCDSGNQNTYEIYSSSNIVYGVASFITQGCTSDVTNENNNFIGTTVISTPGQNGIIGIPVSFSSKFVQSSQYADEYLLDFVITFYYSNAGGSETIKSQHLINGYTINRINDIQATFVNYFQGTLQGNDGQYIPTMLRIKLPTLSINYDKIQIFFDTNIELISSFTDCKQFQASQSHTEVWMFHQSIICNKQTQILIPIIPKGLTKTLHVALTNSIDGILTTIPINVYRILGLQVYGETRKITTSLYNTETQTNLIFPFIRNSKIFDLHIDTTKFIDNQPNVDLQLSTSILSNVILEMNQNNFIGAGLTLTSIGINLFDEATILSYFGQLQCLQFIYNINIYTTFCPFDQQIHYPLQIKNQIIFLLGQYTQLSSIASYAISNIKGQLMAAINDPGIINRLLYTCTLDKTSLIYPNSLGQQRLQFPIRFSSSIRLGGIYYNSIQIVITLQSSITGLNIVTSSNICEIEGLNQISCTYISTSTIITVTLISLIQQIIQSNTVIKLTFLIQSTYGITNFGSNQPFKIQIYLPTIRSSKIQIYGDTYDIQSVLQEQCTYLQLNLQNTQLGNKFYIGNLKLEIPTQNAISTLIFDFQIQSIREYLSQQQQYIQFTLGFLRDQNMENGKLKCQIYQQNQLSTLIYSIDTNNMPYINVYFNQDIQNPHQILFTMKCNNFKTPTNTYQIETFIGKLIEKVGITTLQTSLSIGYSTLNYIQYISQGNIILQQKQLNSPGFDSIYTFNIINGDLKILLTYLIKLKFHNGISLNQYISCQLNNTFCYCTLKDEIYIINICIIIQPQQQFTLKITISQPNRLYWPIQSKIYIAIDQDNDFNNGVYMQEIINDILGDEYQIQPIEIVDTTISSYYIRTTQTHKLIILLPSGSVVENNLLFIHFPLFYMDVLSRTKDITCTLSRDDDILKNNFIKNCTLLTNQYIQMILQDDSANNLIKQYIIELNNIPLPEKEVPQKIWNQYRLKIHIIQSGYTKVKFTSAFYYSKSLSLINEGKLDLLWSGGNFLYQRDETLQYINEVTNIINIYIGTYRTLIRLRSLNLNNFIETFGIQSKDLKTFPINLSVNSGSQSSLFLIGANSNIQIGYQIFKFQKLTGGTSYVSILPNLYVNIINQPCQLYTNQLIYQIPQGGTTQPIVINIQNCYPMQDLRIELFNNNSALNSILNNPQNIIYSGINKYLLYFDKYEYIWQINNNDTILEIGQFIEISFLLTGVSSQYYIPPQNIQIEIIDTQYDYPIIEFDSQPIAYKNDIQFKFKCNNKGTLLWVIGCGTDITYIPLDEIYNKTLYQGYMRTQRNLTDIEWKIYGSQIINGIIIEHFSGLKSFSDYTLQAYCIDLMSISSEPLIYTWQTSFNGGKGIKLNITFNNPLTNIQQLELVCGINFIFTIDYSRITDSRGYNCDIDTLSILSSSANDQISILTGIISSYYIYIQPDLALMDENINIIVQNSFLNKKSFIQLLQNKMNIDPEEDPIIIDAIYTEPDQSIKPILNYTQPIIGSINATMNFTLSNAKGYVGIGVEQTDTSLIPSITQIRRSINYLGRQLLSSKLLFFNHSSPIQNETQQVWFTDLSPNLKYRIYFFYSNDDTSSLALISNVTSIQIQTSPSQTYSESKFIIVNIILIFILLM